jgi:hypothetical protein
MKTKMEKLLSVLLLFFLANSLSLLAGNISLVKNHTANAVVVIPDKANAPEKFAAEELQYHIEKATGVRLPVYKEENCPAAGGNKDRTVIYVGKCIAARKLGIDFQKMSPSAYIIKAAGKNLFLAGKDRVRSTIGNYWGADWQGTLFAVYDFLEHEMNIKWLWPGKLGEIIPRCKSIVVGEFCRKGKPRFEAARLVWSRKSPKFLLGWTKQSKKKFFDDQQLFLLRHRFSSIQNMAYGHNFRNYWKRFGKSHPDFFSLLPDGKRHPLKGDHSGGNITLCVSQPNLWKQIILEWRKSSQRNPEHCPYKPYLNACENDTPGMCTCKACRSWDYPDPAFAKSDYWGKGIIPDIAKRFSLADASWGEDFGVCRQEPPSLSDRYARFYLTLLKEAKKTDPKTKVIGYAYANYWKAPKQIKLNKDIIISYVPPLWFPYTSKMSREFRENWDGWRKSGAQIRLRPNLTHAGANLPIFYARPLAEDFSYAYRQGGMIATHFDSLLGAWSAQGPTLYTLTRIHEHPDWSADKILNEYYSGFGKASKAVRKYFEYWEKLSNALEEKQVKRFCSEERDRKGRPGGSFKNYILIAHRIFPPQVFIKAHKLIAKAKQAAKGDKLAEKRVAYIEKGLIDAELTVKVRVAQKKMQKTPSKENKKAFLKAFEKLKKYRAEIEADNVCNFGYMAYREKHGASWPWENN